MFSLGVVFYEVLCGKPPFGGKRLRQEGSWVMYAPISTEYSQDARDLIGGLLSVVLSLSIFFFLNPFSFLFLFFS
jgi:serine/threonine protein kinase